MKKRRGFLLAEETLKIIIALICLGFLAYFLASLYFASQSSNDLDLAKASLKHIIDDINAGVAETEVFNPEGWVLVSWPYQDDENYPDSCNGKSCICFVGDIVVGGSVSDLGYGSKADFEKVKLEFLDQSNNPKESVCINSDYSVQNGVIKIDTVPTNLLIDKENKIISKK